MLNIKTSKKILIVGFGCLTSMCLFLAFSCGQTAKRDAKKFSPENLVLNPADNVIVSGKTVTLTNNSSSQTNGFSLTFANVGSLTCNDVSIKTTAAYGFVPNGSSFIPSPVTSTMPQYTCTKTGSTIVLSSAPPLTEGFHPWVENFNINMGTTVFTVTVNTPASPTQLLSRGTQAQMYLDPAFTGCGLHGTILQRVFDCSKKIINYGVTVTAANSACGSADTPHTCDYYTKFSDPNSDNPDLFWFVVACPNTSGSNTVPQQSCHSLTPVVPAGNPALDATPGGYPTFQLSMLTGYQKRLLFSGKMINGGSGYNFAQSNGFAFSGTNELYVGTGTPAPNPGTTPSNGQPPHTSPSVCVAPTGQSLQGSGSFPSSDANIRDIVSLATGATISGAAAGWQIPSYAMANILTGGTPTNATGAFCPAIGQGPSLGRPYCDMPTPANTDNKGFSAVNVPGFSMSNSFLVSEVLISSSNYDLLGSVWVFDPHNGSGYGGNVEDYNLTSLSGVRCVAPTWY